jgi:hypothetical protein
MMSALQSIDDDFAAGSSSLPRRLTETRALAWVPT